MVVAKEEAMKSLLAFCFALFHTDFVRFVFFSHPYQDLNLKLQQEIF